MSAGYQKHTTETKTGKSDPKIGYTPNPNRSTPDRNITHFYSGKRGVSSKHSTEAKTGNRTLKSVILFESEPFYPRLQQHIYTVVKMGASSKTLSKPKREIGPKFGYTIRSQSNGDN